VSILDSSTALPNHHQRVQGFVVDSTEGRLVVEISCLQEKKARKRNKKNEVLSFIFF
jgi:hypothetical protein